jgi:hypothetical protein
MDNTIGALPKVRFGDWIGEGWNMFAAEWKVWVLNALVLALVSIVPLLGMYFLFFIGMAAASSAGGPPEIGFGLFLLFPLVVLLVGLLTMYVSAGMYRCAFKQLRGEPISTSDLFTAGDCFLQCVIASILIGILTTIGFLLCIVPAFIVMGALYFTLPLIVEGRLGPVEAMQRSRDATRGDLFMFILFALVVTFLAQAGSYLCYVGLLITMPLQFTIGAVAYRDCFGVPGARSFSSKPPTPQGYAAPPPGGYPQYPYGAPPPAGYQPQAPSPWSTPASTSPYPPPPQPPPPPSFQAPYQAPAERPSPPPSAFPQSAPPQSPSAPVPPSTSGTAPQQSSPTSQIVCPSCQAELPASARFCARCGRMM